MGTPATVVSSCGARFDGIQESSRGEGIVLFTDPVTRTTSALPLSQVTTENVERKLREKRDLFREAMLRAAAQKHSRTQEA